MEKIGGTSGMGISALEEFKNLWLGVSVEKQKLAEERIPMLASLPTPVRFISFEPLLSPIDLSFLGDVTQINQSFDWAIIGGESDFKSPRIMEYSWVDGLISQLSLSGIPIFFKQWGGRKKIDGSWGGNEVNGHKFQEFPLPTRKVNLKYPDGDLEGLF